MTENKDKKGYPFLILGGVVAMLFAASLVPWGDLTGNYIKNFNLLADVFPGSIKATAQEIIDPELESALAEAGNVNKTTLSTDSAGNTVITPASEGSLSLHEVETPKEEIDNVVDGVVIIEDYSMNGNGLANFKKAVSESSHRTVRIAVIGDSYIEGDILTQDIRQSLQNRFGGQGVGYVPAYNAQPGFRQTVRQTSSGWTEHEIRHNMPENMKILAGEYYTSGGNGSASFKGTTRYENLDKWSRTSVLATAPEGGIVTLTTDNGSEDHQIAAGNQVTAITAQGTTTSATVTASAGVNVLGIYLDGDKGVQVDNMSLRGNSGQTHRKLSAALCNEMRQYIDYDLIVVEYGINALSSQQSNYNGYKNIMKQTVSRLRECYPEADILVMGIGDRGQKLGTEIKSIPTAPNMVKAQRDVARETGVLFWDTRKAMGGQDAVVEWRNKGLINPDFIHLNKKGGQAMAELFVKALFKAL